MTGAASLFRIHPKRIAPLEYRDAYLNAEEASLMRRMSRYLLEAGVLLPYGAAACLSTAMVDSDIDLVLSAFDEFLQAEIQKEVRAMTQQNPNETVAAGIATILRRHDVEFIFGQSLPSAVILAAESDRHSPDRVPAGEHGRCDADGYARLSGKVAVVCRPKRPRGNFACAAAGRGVEG